VDILHTIGNLSIMGVWVYLEILNLMFYLDSFSSLLIVLHQTFVLIGILSGLHGSPHNNPTEFLKLSFK
jgi:hypothetical protein